jgi:hypothetical protein
VNASRAVAARGALIGTLAAVVVALSSACGSPASAEREGPPVGGQVQQGGKGGVAADPRATPPPAAPGAEQPGAK